MNSFPLSAFNPVSFASVHLTIHDGNGNQAGATGFYGKFGNSYHLITARHCVLGLKSFHPSAYSERRWIPRFIDTNCLRINGSIMENLSVSINLRTVDGLDTWQEFGDWDIATFDLTETVCADGYKPIAIDLSEVNVMTDEEGKMSSVQSDVWLPPVSSDVFVVGYPSNIAYLTSNSTPIWKKASIATEPHIGLGENPIFLVDTMGRSGLSGSPVIYQGDVLISPTGQRRKPASAGNLHLIGIYVGREGEVDVELGLSLGRVFKRHAIQDTIMAPR